MLNCHILNLEAIQIKLNNSMSFQIFNSFMDQKQCNTK